MSAERVKSQTQGTHRVAVIELSEMHWRANMLKDTCTIHQDMVDGTCNALVQSHIETNTRQFRFRWLSETSSKIVMDIRKGRVERTEILTCCEDQLNMRHIAFTISSY